MLITFQIAWQSRGGKLCFGPVWDFNIAFANVDYLEGYKADGLVTPGPMVETDKGK